MKPYTPRPEYQCDSSDTHYQGCKCHEERHAVEIGRLRAALQAAMNTLNWIAVMSEDRNDLAFQFSSHASMAVDEIDKILTGGSQKEGEEK